MGRGQGQSTASWGTREEVAVFQALDETAETAAQVAARAKTEESVATPILDLFARRGIIIKEGSEPASYRRRSYTVNA